MQTLLFNTLSNACKRVEEMRHLINTGHPYFDFSIKSDEIEKQRKDHEYCYKMPDKACFYKRLVSPDAKFSCYGILMLSMRRLLVKGYSLIRIASMSRSGLVESPSRFRKRINYKGLAFIERGRLIDAERPNQCIFINSRFEI